MSGAVGHTFLHLYACVCVCVCVCVHMRECVPAQVCMYMHIPKRVLQQVQSGDSGRILGQIGDVLSRGSHDVDAVSGGEGHRVGHGL